LESVAGKSQQAAFSLGLFSRFNSIHYTRKNHIKTVPSLDIRNNHYDLVIKLVTGLGLKGHFAMQKGRPRFAKTAIFVVQRRSSSTLPA